MFALKWTQCGAVVSCHNTWRLACLQSGLACIFRIGCLSSMGYSWPVFATVYDVRWCLLSYSSSSAERCGHVVTLLACGGGRAPGRGRGGGGGPCGDPLHVQPSLSISITGMASWL